MPAPRITTVIVNAEQPERLISFWCAFFQTEVAVQDAGIVLHLSEVKGPVMDRLKTTDWLARMRGQVFLTHYQAVQQLAPELFAEEGPAPLRSPNPV